MVSYYVLIWSSNKGDPRFNFFRCLGARTADGIVDRALSEISSIVRDRMGGRSSGGGSKSV